MRRTLCSGQNLKEQRTQTWRTRRETHRIWGYCCNPASHRTHLLRQAALQSTAGTRRRTDGRLVALCPPFLPKQPKPCGPTSRKNCLQATRIGPLFALTRFLVTPCNGLLPMRISLALVLHSRRDGPVLCCNPTLGKRERNGTAQLGFQSVALITVEGDSGKRGEAECSSSTELRKVRKAKPLPVPP